MNVLVVEDDPNVLAFIDRALTQKGHTVLAAGDPDHARFVVTEHGDTVDLLLVDIVLPGANGLDFARAMKKEHAEMKIIFMTGMAHRSPQVLRSGLGPVLHKPFTVEELFRTIDNIQVSSRKHFTWAFIIVSIITAITCVFAVWLVYHIVGN